MFDPEVYVNEMKRRIDFVEYRILSMLLNYFNRYPLKSLSEFSAEEHAKGNNDVYQLQAILRVLNPRNENLNHEFCADRMTDLEEQYYDELDRLKSD